MTKVEFHHCDGKNDCGQPFYTTVFVDGYEIGCFRPDDAEASLTTLIERICERSKEQAIKEHQENLRKLLSDKYWD